jgi:hypothetical protein
MAQFLQEAPFIGNSEIGNFPAVTFSTPVRRSIKPMENAIGYLQYCEQSTSYYNLLDHAC